MTSGHTLRARMAMAEFFTLQAQAIAGFSSCEEANCYPEILQYRTILYKTTFVLGKLWRHVSGKNSILLYSVKAHVPTHGEGRKELGINGSSDLVDLGTFREDSQIDFATGNVFCKFGGREGGGWGVTQEGFSNFSINRYFFKQRNYRKNFVRKEEFYRQHNFKPNKSFKLEQIWRRQLHSWLPIGTIRITRLGLGPILRVIYISERTHFKLIIDKMSRQGVEVWEKCTKNVSRRPLGVARSICESSLRLIIRSSEESTWSGVPLTLQSNWSVYVHQSMYNSCISSWKRGTAKCKFSAWKVIIIEMECKSGCHERGKSSIIICNIGLKL